MEHTAQITPLPISNPIQFTHQLHTSLDQDNYLLWKSQVVPLLRGNGLLAYVEGPDISPSDSITINGVTTPNPEFDHWQRQDQLLLAWLFNSLSSSILAQVISCTTSRQLWEKLSNLHTTQSIAKTLELKLKLQTARKGSSTCAQFLQQIQEIADRLRSVGSLVSEQELTLYALQGLGPEYENFVTAISIRQQPLSMPELRSLLLAHEARLQTSLHLSLSSPSAHLTTRGGDISGLLGPSPTLAQLTEKLNQLTNGGHLAEAHFAGVAHGGQLVNGQNPATPKATQGYASVYPPKYNNSNSNRGRSNSRGRGRGRSSNSDRPPLQCQICFKWGHPAWKCYHRFNPSYTGESSAPPQPQQALLAQPTSLSQAPSQSWFLDSGATAHIRPLASALRPLTSPPPSPSLLSFHYPSLPSAQLPLFRIDFINLLKINFNYKLRI